MERLAQVNAVLTSSKCALMAQLEQITATMSVIQAQLNILSSAATTITKIK